MTITILILGRLVFGVVTLFTISILIFLGTVFLPGDVAEAILGQAATDEAVAVLREQLGLNRPLTEQYFSWLLGFATGDLGNSLASGAPVSKVVSGRLLNTVLLAVYAIILALPLALFLGFLCAAYPDSRLDRTISIVSVFTISIPDFVIALFLVIIFAVELRWFPTLVYRPNWGDPLSMMHKTFLPVVTLLFTMLAYMIRMIRAAILETLKTAYAEMALLKGAKKFRVIVRHGLPNAIGPIVNVVALNVGYLISGVAVVEIVFSYPGLGRLMIDAVLFRDLPVLQATVMIFAALFIAANLIADVAGVAANPRLRSHST